MLEAERDWVNGYWTAIRHVSRAIESQWLDPVVQFLVTLLAGALSYYVARTMLVRQEKIAEAKVRASEQQVAKDALIVASNKLIECGEILAGMRNLMDEQFIDAALEGMVHEPFQTIRSTVGVDYTPEKVLLSEVFFLYRAKDVELINDLQLVYRRTINCTHLSETYSNLRVAMHGWMQSLPGYSGVLDGEIADESFPAEHLPKFERKAADLNRIIESLVSQLDDTIALTESVICRLGKAGKTEFGQDFLVFDSEFPSVLLRLEDLRLASKAADKKFNL